MRPATVNSYDDVVENVRSFNRAVEDNADSAAARLRSRLGTFRAWYYVPELDQVGPSKFIGYSGMTAARYVQEPLLRAGRTEAVLPRWFEVVPPDSAEGDYIASMVAELLRRYGKTPGGLARYCAPRGWRVGNREWSFRHQGIAESPANYREAGRPPSKVVQAIIRRGDEQFVAECVDLAVVTQGRTLDEVAENLQEAVALHLEGEDPAGLGLIANPAIIVTMELEPAHA